MNFINLTKNYDSLSIIGTCKNAGKTTVLNLLLDQNDLGITSVGFDGETIDSVTKTPKPKIFIKKNTLVATANSLLSQCTTSKEILLNTGISTPMGEVIIFKSMDDGFVQLAGPSITSELITLKKIFFKLGAKKIIIDGALNRKSISSPNLVDAAILSTGASYNKNIEKVIEDTSLLLTLYDLPILSFEPKESLDLIDDLQNDKKFLYTSGALTDKMLKSISMKKNINSVVIGVEDPSKILANKETLSVFFARGGKIEVKNKVKIIAVTINPYSAYGWHFDKDVFKNRMKELTDLPIINALEKENEL